MTADLFLTNVAFYVFGAIALIGALIAVAQQNILRAALGLIVSFMGVAGIYFVLEAEFIAVVQILVYVGAIAILILFAVMLTRGLMRSAASAHNSQWIGAGMVSVLLFALLAMVALGTKWNVGAQKITGDLIPKIGTELMTTYLLPFEAVSLLLLAALVGAIVIAREQ
jgi:NADH:ubiquinone oxidoreductase subunit 6 (subunit J)